VHDECTGCFHSNVRDYEWIEAAGDYSFKGQHISRAEIEELRKQAMLSSGLPDDLLAQIGFTPAALAAHHQDVLEAAWPESFRPENGERLVLPAELDRLLSFEALAPHVLAELQGRNWSSTTHYELQITLPGDPPIVVQSASGVAWKLPWEIEVGSKRWTSSNPALSRALLRLVDREGPNAGLLDGDVYWSQDFWHDEDFWGRWVGRDLETALAESVYSKLDGYSAAMDRFRVEKAESGSINGLPESLFLTIETRQSSAIDGAWWWNPLKDGKPTSDWNEFVAVFDGALRSVEKMPWLKDWKLAGPDRTIEAHVVGTLGYSESGRERVVSPAWEDAGLQGAPDFEVLLRRKDKWCGTIWLSASGDGALVANMQAGPGEGWLDQLEVSYPTYVRVDAAGTHETRTLP
jgi:hypothetical protein